VILRNTCGNVFFALLGAACVGAPPTQDSSGSERAAAGAGARELSPSERIELARSIHRPGPMHRALDPLQGDWDIRVHRQEVDGSQARELGVGRAHLSWTMGGLFLHWEVELEVGGGEHSVNGFLGYDVVQEQYQALWVSELASGLSLAQGDGDLAGRGIVLQTPGSPRRGFPGSRSVLRLLDRDHFTIESIGVNARGEEGVVQRAIYSRQSS
jgi:hypothetical protein